MDSNEGGLWSTSSLAQPSTSLSDEIKSSLVMGHSVLWDDDVDHPYLLDWFQSHLDMVLVRANVAVANPDLQTYYNVRASKRSIDDDDDDIVAPAERKCT